MGERGQSPKESARLQPGGQKFVFKRHKLVDALPGRRSPASLGIENRTQILNPLSWDEVRLLWGHYNTQLPTKRENSTKSLENYLARAGLNKPVVEVRTHTNAETVENGRDRSHNPGEELGSRGEAKAEPETGKACRGPQTTGTYDCPGGRGLASTLPSDRWRPSSRQTDQQKNRLNGLHLEGSLENEAIEDREVYHGSPQPGGLPNDKHPAVKARRRKRS